MKKALLALLLVFLFCSNTFAHEENVTINLFGDILSDKGVIIDGRTLLPVREIYEKLGYKVDYDKENKVVLITKGSSLKLTYTAGSTIMTNNSISFNLDSPAQIINDKFMMPIRSINNAMYLDIKWDGETKTVYVDKPDDVSVTVINVS